MELNTYIQFLATQNPSFQEISTKKTLPEPYLVEVEEMLAQINELNKKLMDIYTLKNQKFDIDSTKLVLPNGVKDVYYEAPLDLSDEAYKHANIIGLDNLENTGLEFDTTDYIIKGKPKQSGDFNLKLKYKLKDEVAQENIYEKPITLIINPNPKELWKDIPSDQEVIFAKPDKESSRGQLGEKNIVVASNRGRSHANVGSHRDDDFAFKQYPNDWNIVVVSDGAGSASFSKKGSELACSETVSFFESEESQVQLQEIQDLFERYQKETHQLLWQEIEVKAKKLFYKAAMHVHTKIKEFAQEDFAIHPAHYNDSRKNSPEEYYHATLVFSLFKKIDEKYLVLTFSVGDCPAALVEGENALLLNILDVGEFGGGTRFITPDEIFRDHDAFYKRVSIHEVPDFDYLFLMTDGVYDAKFEVEANLEKNEKWQEFIADLNGANPEEQIVHFSPENQNINDELTQWLDFWSLGNHDDRTLAIVYS